ncbi:hypothetical protein FE257_005672, partial [Aspergillus nanangensis]
MGWCNRGKGEYFGQHVSGRRQTWINNAGTEHQERPYGWESDNLDRAASQPAVAQVDIQEPMRRVRGTKLFTAKRHTGGRALSHADALTGGRALPHA